MRDLKRRSAAAVAGAAPAPAASDMHSDVPYIETLTHIFETVASAFLLREQLLLFIGGAATAAAALQAAHQGAVQHELAVIDAFVEDFSIAKRAQTLRSKQVRIAPKLRHESLYVMLCAGQHLRREEN